MVVHYIDRGQSIGEFGSCEDGLLERGVSVPCWSGVGWMGLDWAGSGWWSRVSFGKKNKHSEDSNEVFIWEWNFTLVFIKKKKKK